MNPTAYSWTEVVAVYHQALTIPEADRTAYLQARCGVSTPLFFEVQALLVSREPPQRIR